MTVKQALLNWLQGPRRTYAEGLALFGLIADNASKVRFIPFFREEMSPAPNDIHINLLVDKLSRFGREIRVNPQYRSEVMSSEFVFSPSEHTSTAERQPVSAASHPAPSGVRFTYPSGLPDSLRDSYDRIREITPQYARLHADLGNATSDDERKDLANRLCALDDERRRLWDKLDSWAKESGVKTEIPRPSYSRDEVLSGLEMAARRKRLKDNIRTARLSVARFTKNGPQSSLHRAEARLESYMSELDDLERRIADAQC